MVILTNKKDLHFSYTELDKASKLLAEVLNLQAIYKAEPAIKPEWAKKYKLIWNDETHRWNKPDSQEDASEAILESHEVQVGENYVIGPKAHNKKLIGHEVKILGLKGDDIVVFDLDGKKGQMYKKNLEKWLEEDLVEEKTDKIQIGDTVKIIAPYYAGETAKVIGVEDNGEYQIATSNGEFDFLGAEDLEVISGDDALWEDPDKPKFEIGSKVIITNSDTIFMQDYLGQSGTIIKNDDGIYGVELSSGNTVWVKESEIVNKDEYEAELGKKENEPLWEQEESAFKPGDKVTAYGGSTVGTINSVEGDILVVNIDGELYELSSNVVEKVSEEDKPKFEVGMKVSSLGSDGYISAISPVTGDITINWDNYSSDTLLVSTIMEYINSGKLTIKGYKQEEIEHEIKEGTYKSHIGQDITISHNENGTYDLKYEDGTNAKETTEKNLQYVLGSMEYIFHSKSVTVDGYTYTIGDKYQIEEDLTYIITDIGENSLELTYSDGYKVITSIPKDGNTYGQQIDSDVLGEIWDSATEDDDLKIGDKVEIKWGDHAGEIGHISHDFGDGEVKVNFENGASLMFYVSDLDKVKDIKSGDLLTHDDLYEGKEVIVVNTSSLKDIGLVNLAGKSVILMEVDLYDGDTVKVLDENGDTWYLPFDTFTSKEESQKIESEINEPLTWTEADKADINIGDKVKYSDSMSYKNHYGQEGKVISLPDKKGIYEVEWPDGHTENVGTFTTEVMPNGKTESNTWKEVNDNHEIESVSPEEVKTAPIWLPANSVKLEVGYVVKIGPKSKAKDLVGKEAKIIAVHPNGKDVKLDIDGKFRSINTLQVLTEGSSNAGAFSTSVTGQSLTPSLPGFSVTGFDYSKLNDWRSDTYKNEKLYQKHPNKPTKLSDGTRDFLGGGSTSANSSIRNGRPNYTAKAAKAQMLEMKQPYTIYRGPGIELDQFLKDIDTKAAGGTYTFPNLLSCSRDPKFAWDWAGGGGSKQVFLEFKTLADTRAITVTKDLKPPHNEWETTLDWGQKARVDEIKWVNTGLGKRPVISLTMLPNTAGVNVSDTSGINVSDTSDINAQISMINETGEWIPAVKSELQKGQEVQISPEAAETYGNSGIVNYVYKGDSNANLVAIQTKNGEIHDILVEFINIKNPDFNPEISSDTELNIGSQVKLTDGKGSKYQDQNGIVTDIDSNGIVVKFPDGKTYWYLPSQLSPGDSVNFNITPIGNTGAIVGDQYEITMPAGNKLTVTISGFDGNKVQTYWSTGYTNEATILELQELFNSDTKPIKIGNAHLSEKSSWGGNKTEPEPSKAAPLTYTKIGGALGGSGSGGVYQDQHGKKSYIKSGKIGHTQNEWMAGEFYRKAGVNFPNTEIINHEGNLSLKSDWLEDLEPMTAEDMQKHPDVREGFVVDAWLGNWDAVGTGANNMMQSKDGKVHRIESGGALLFRAQGQPKQLDDHVSELETMLDPSISPEGSIVFKNMKPSELKAGALKVMAFTDEDIDNIVNQSKFESASFLADKLKKRRDSIVKKYITE